MSVKRVKILYSSYPWESKTYLFGELDGLIANVLFLEKSFHLLQCINQFINFTVGITFTDGIPHFSDIPMQFCFIARFLQRVLRFVVPPESDEVKYSKCAGEERKALLMRHQRENGSFSVKEQACRR